MKIRIKATDDKGNVIYEGKGDSSAGWVNAILWDDDLEDALAGVGFVKDGDKEVPASITIVAVLETASDDAVRDHVNEDDDSDDGVIAITQRPDDPETKTFNEATGEFTKDDTPDNPQGTPFEN